MNIVILSSFFFPVIQPRSFRATELAKEFAREGHRVGVITMNTVAGFDYDCYSKENGITISHLNIFKGDGTALAAGKTETSNPVRDFCVRAARYLFCGRMIQYTRQIYAALLKEPLLKDADMVIALSTPFCIHWALSKYIKKRGKHFLAVADSGDPFYFSKQWKLACWFKYIEKDVYRQMDYLTIPTPNAIPSYNLIIPENKIKIIPQGFDMSHLNLYDGDFGERIKMAYAGVFYWDIRNPEFLFRYLDSCSTPYELYLYLRYGDAVLERTILKYPNLEKHLHIQYNVPHDALIYELSTMHFLINVENISNTQMPSKLIDYGMTGRPILSCNENNFSVAVMDAFMKGDYRGQYHVDVEQYNIVNIAGKFLSLS